MRGHADAEAFSNELASLKRGGCNVLVVSDAAGRDPACERLLGAPELDRRHVFLTTSTPVSSVLDRYSPRRTDSSSLGIVDATPGHETRSAAAASAPLDEGTSPSIDSSTQAADWYDSVDSLTDYDALFHASRNALERVSDGVDGPGEVRFCLDGLDALLEAGEREEVAEESLFTFLHLLASTVRDTDGMGHFHVSEQVGEDRLGTFEPLFDATLHIDTSETGAPRQRWELHESGRVTDWFEF
jgi:hypothetical protein